MRRIIILGIILIILIFLFWYYAPIGAIFYRLADFFKILAEKNGPLAMLIFFILSMLSAMLMPFSNVPLVPFASMIWGNTATFILLYTGWLIGDMASYTIGWFAGYPLFEKLMIFKNIQKYRRHLNPESEFSIVLLVRLVMPAELTGYLLGILKYHFGKYMIATFLSELPVAIITVFISEAILQKKILLSIALMVALILIFVISYSMLMKNNNKNPKNDGPR